MTTDSMVGSFTVAEVGSLSMGDLSNNQSINQSINQFTAEAHSNARQRNPLSDGPLLRHKQGNEDDEGGESLGALVSCPISICSMSSMVFCIVP